VRDVEEHYVATPGFGQQTYAFWRFGLSLRRRLRVRSRRYESARALLSALESDELSARALVFLDVRYQALDTQHDELIGFSSGLDQRFVDPTCVYDYTPDLVRRSTLLRRALAYARPLTLVISGDVACRLRLPRTHHRVVLSNDAAQAQCDELDARASWWPQGLEGLKSYASEDSRRDALTITEATYQPPNQRLFLLADSMSVNLRKPSRKALVQALPNVTASLKALAFDRGLSLSLRATTTTTTLQEEEEEEEEEKHVVSVQSGPPHDAAVARLAREEYGGNEWRARVASSQFALCPAGDVYSSGRVLTALYLGAVPIIDATYLSDGGLSAKGCADPARFWREGSADFPHAAPFVFVKDWTELPAQLASFDLSFDALRRYKSKLEAYLLQAAVRSDDDDDDTAPATTCRETPLSDDERDRLRAQAADYYRNPHWLSGHRDTADVPGATCLHNASTEMAHLDMGAPCFDPRCAPPLVEAFDCWPSSR